MAASNRRPQRMMQNFHLVWLDANIDEENNEDCRNSITQLRRLVNTVNTFVDADECIDFITDMEEVQALLIASEEFEQLVQPIAQQIHQINSIYILSMNKTSHDKLANKPHKLNGIFTNITSICQAIEHDIRNSDKHAVSISFLKKIEGISPKQSIDSLDKSFMYTQILKEILLTIDFEEFILMNFLPTVVNNSSAIRLN